MLPVIIKTMDRKLLIKFGTIILISLVINITLEKLFNINLKTLENWVLYFGIWAPAVYSFFLFLGLSVPFNPISDFLVVNLAAFLFPPYLAIPATLVAHLLALTTNYWIARKFGKRFVKLISTEKEREEIEKLTKEIHLPWIFGLRFFLPLTAVGIDIVSYAAGIAKLPFAKFMLVSLIPWTFYSVVYFLSTSYLKNISPILFFLPAAVLLALPVIFVTFRKKEGFLHRFSPFKK